MTSSFRSVPLMADFPTAFRYSTVEIHFDFQLCNSTLGPGSTVWIQAQCKFIEGIGGGILVQIPTHARYPQHRLRVDDNPPLLLVILSPQ